MTARGFAFIVSRAMAVYLFIGILNVLPMNISAVASVRNAGAEAWLAVAMLGLISLVYVSLVLWLWIKADWLADLMEGGIPEPASAGEKRYFDPDSLAQVGVSLIGVYVFSEAFPKATQAITLVAFQNRLGDTPHYGSSLAASWVSLGVQLVLGLWLMFSARGLVRFIRWAREAGVVKGPQNRGED